MQKLILSLNLIVLSLVGNSCLHYEYSAGQYDYETKSKTVKGQSNTSKVGLGNVMGKGAFGFNIGGLFRKYSDIEIGEDSGSSTVSTTGSYLAFSAGVPFGENNSIFAEYEYQSESFDLNLFDHQIEDRQNLPDEDSIGFKTVRSNTYSIGYRHSNFWKKSRRTKKARGHNGLHVGGNWGSGGEGAILLATVVIVFVVAEVIANEIAENANIGRYHSFSWLVKYNYRHTVFPNDSLLYGMDSNHNEMHERSVTAGLIVDWI